MLLGVCRFPTCGSVSACCTLYWSTEEDLWFWVSGSSHRGNGNGGNGIIPFGKRPLRCGGASSFSISGMLTVSCRCRARISSVSLEISNCCFCSELCRYSRSSLSMLTVVVGCGVLSRREIPVIESIYKSCQSNKKVKHAYQEKPRLENKAYPHSQNAERKTGHGFIKWLILNKEIVASSLKIMRHY